MSLTLLSRADWGALPLTDVVRFSRPQFCFWHHTTGATLGRDLSDDWVRNIDRQHKYANGWAGIGYSFLYDDWGQIFEGRGWGVVGAHTEGWNSKGHGFAYLGDGDKPMSDLAIEAARYLQAESDKRYGRTQSLGHRDKGQTHCPGDWLYSHIGSFHGGGAVGAPVTAGTDLGVSAGRLQADGGFGPLTVRALQASLNNTGASPRLVVDGVYGPATKKALQARLNHVVGPVAIDGVIGPNTVRALQRYIGAGVDGSWGRQTTTALQQKLISGTF